MAVVTAGLAPPPSGWIQRSLIVTSQDRKRVPASLGTAIIGRRS